MQAEADGASGAAVGAAAPAVGDEPCAVPLGLFGDIDPIGPQLRVNSIR